MTSHVAQHSSNRCSSRAKCPARPRPSNPHRAKPPFSSSPPAALPPSKAPTDTSQPLTGVLSRSPQPAPYASSASPASSTSAAPAAGQASPPLAAAPSPTGYIALSLVPILWGTYNPCIRYLYAEPNPLDPASLTAVRTALSAGALLLPALLGFLYQKGREAWLHNRSRNEEDNHGSNGVGSNSNSSSSTSDVGGSMHGVAVGAQTRPHAHAQAHPEDPGHPSPPQPPQREPLGRALAAIADGAADGVAAAAAAAAAADEDEDGIPDASLASLRTHPGNAAMAAAAAAAAPDSSQGGTGSTGSHSNAAVISSSSSSSSSSGRGGLFSEPLSGVRLGPVLTRTFRSVVLGGLELGVLNFIGTALQVEGLHSTSATRAGFLAELTAVLTPLVSYMAGYDIPRQMWVAVAVGLVGSTMVAYDTSLVHDSQSFGSAEAVSSVAATSTSSPAPVSANATAAGGGSAAAADAPSLAATAVAPAASGYAGPDAANTATSSLSGNIPIDGAWPHSATPVMADGAAIAAASSHTSAAPALLADSMLATSPTVDELLSAAAVAPGFNDGASLAAPALADGLLPAANAVATAAMSSASTAADAAVELVGGAAGDAATSAIATAATTAATVATGASAAAAEAAVAAVAPAATQLAITGGEAYLLLACLFYSLCTIRMGLYAPRMDTVQLAAMKKVGLSSMSLLWMATNNLQSGAALDSVFAFPDLSTRTPLSVAVLLYSGLGPGASATFLQVTGLSTVPATTAQVIYSMTPLLTAFFAFLILGGEATGPVAWAGGSLIIVAALVAADAQHKQHRPNPR